MGILHLPKPTTSFVGRSEELERIAAPLADPNCRLLTLLGVGGIGKTRLAAQAAEQQLSYFSDGGYFVALTGVRSAELIPSALISALAIPFYGTEDPRLQIFHFLREKQILLIMDNFEHLLKGTELLTEILQAAPLVKFLVTSRERLNMQEEWVLPLEGLSFPGEPTSTPLESYSAVQLFVQRARQVQATFSLQDNADAVKRICQQVEGMPLGLELASTWLRAMSCQQIAAQMESGAEFLITSLRNIPERHRSVQGVFEQSWDLLSPLEQDVLMRLSFFRGGFALEAAEQVAGATLTIIAGLVDRSLIRLTPSGRYDLHELLRQFATDKLQDAGEVTSTAYHHLRYFMKLAERSEAYLERSDWKLWHDRLEAELDNLRAALTWSMQNGKAELGLRLAAALTWPNRNKELLEWLEQLLALTPDIPLALRAKALNVTGATATYVGEERRAQEYLMTALELARMTNDTQNIAWALAHLGFYIERHQNPCRAASLLEESMTLFRLLADPVGIGHLLRRRAKIAIDQSDYDYGRTLLMEDLPRAREANDMPSIAAALSMLGNIAWQLDHNYRQALTLYQESVSLYRELDDILGISCVLIDMARLEQMVRHYSRSQALYKETLNLLWQTGLYNSMRTTATLAGFASLACVLGRLEWAATLFGAVEIGVKEGFRPDSPDRAAFEIDVASTRAQLGEIVFVEAWGLGKAMTREKVLAYALHNVALESTQTRQKTNQLHADYLTTREIELLRLIAEGCSNREIAARLHIGVSTVKKHINHIYDKLDAKNRTQALARAREQRVLG